MYIQDAHSLLILIVDILIRIRGYYLKKKKKKRECRDNIQKMERFSETNLFSEARIVLRVRSPDSRQSTSPLIRVFANLTQVSTLFRSGCCTCPQHTNVYNSSPSTCIYHYPVLGRSLNCRYKQ